jgi:MFS family permease
MLRSRLQAAEDGPGGNPLADPRDVLLKSPMTVMQVVIVAITIFLNALDGFDVLSISFASPGIRSEWGLGQQGLGFVLSAELIGMALGSIFLGGLADKIGRRPTVLGCLVVMALGMYMATSSGFVVGGIVEPIYSMFVPGDVDPRLADLATWRIVTGLGIGGMLASINAVTAEFSNEKRRDISVAIMSIGYPVGAAAGGFITSAGLELAEWRSVFQFGAIVTTALIPIVFFFMPESVHWLARKQPKNALERINYTLKKIGHGTVTALPVVSAEIRKLVLLRVEAQLTGRRVQAAVLLRHQAAVVAVAEEYQHTLHAAGLQSLVGAGGELQHVAEWAGLGQ